MRTYVKSSGNNDIIEITVNQSDFQFLMDELSMFIKETVEKTTGVGEVKLSPTNLAIYFAIIT